MIERIRRLSVAIRSVLAFGVIGLVLLALGIFSLVEFKQVSDQITYITAQRIPSIELVNNIDREFLRVRVHTANVEAADTPALREGYLTKIADAKSNLIKNQQALSKIVSSPEAKSLLNDYEQLDRQYWVLHDRYLELIANNNEQAAKQLRRDKQLPLTAQISAQLDTFLTYQGQKVDEATQKADNVVSAASLAIIIAIVLTVVLVASFSILFTKSIVRPIRDALNIAKRISQKDLSKPIEVDGNDEISELIRQLSQTQGSLRDSISAISHSAEQLATTSEQLSSVTNDASATIQNQSDEVDQASRSINELTKAVEAVAEDAQKASDSSDVASDKANLGGSKVHEAEIAIENLVSDMSISTDKVSELAVKVNDITKVLEVIRGIADQTNLLALNAAIEAARAGESGRGFSVVADEVRALAQRTQESTVEIEELVSIINKSSSDSVKTMQQSATRASESLDIAKDAGTALKEIMHAVEEIKNRNASIASAAEEQATTSKVIDQNLIKVRDLASSTASGAEQSNVSASDLARLATSLNDMTVEFKL